MEVFRYYLDKIIIYLSNIRLSTTTKQKIDGVKMNKPSKLIKKDKTINGGLNLECNI